MQVVNKSHIPGMMILTLDGPILGTGATKVRVNGKEYDFDIAYDMENTIGIKTDDPIGETVELV